MFDGQNADTESAEDAPKLADVPENEPAEEQEKEPEDAQVRWNI